MNGNFQKGLLFSDWLAHWTNDSYETRPYEFGGDGSAWGNDMYAETLLSGISLTVFSLGCSCSIEKASALKSGGFENA